MANSLDCLYLKAGVIGVVIAIIMLVIIAQMWSARNGQLRKAWDRRGVSRLAAIGVTVAALVICFGGVTEIGIFATLGILIGVPSAVIIYLMSYRGKLSGFWKV